MVDLARVIAKLTAPMKRRIMLMVGRAVLRAVNDGSKLQTVQLSGLKGEVLDGLERFQQYGFTGHPHPEAEAVLLALGGNRNHSVVIAVDDRRYRLKDMGQGDVALYSSGGNHVILRANGDIEAHAPGDLSVTCGGDATIDAQGEARIEGEVARLHGRSATVVECSGHGFVLYPTYRDDYTIGSVAGQTYTIATPEITP